MDLQGAAALVLGTSSGREDGVETVFATGGGLTGTLTGALSRAGVGWLRTGAFRTTHSPRSSSSSS